MRATIHILLMGMILGGFLALTPAGSAQAIEPGVYFVVGNPSCASLNSMSLFDNITSDFGFKTNGLPTVGINYYFTSAYGELTGGAPEDPANYVSFPYVNNPILDWAASLGIDAVIVKGGPNADAYVYVPEATSGQGLTPPMGPNGEPYGISHVEFCYDYNDAQFEVRKSLPYGPNQYAGDPGYFNLLIDGYIYAQDVGGTAGLWTTGPQIVEGGSTHAASETAGAGTSLEFYYTTWSCDFASGGHISSGVGISLNVDIPQGAHVVCTFTNIDPPTAVTFANIEALSEDGQVTLSWETAQEIDLIGFNIFRSETEKGERTRVNSGMIEAQGVGGVSGASYQFVDTNVQRGLTYFYWIQLEEIGGAHFSESPAVATVYYYLRLPVVIR